MRIFDAIIEYGSGKATILPVTEDDKTVLELADDAARVNWGGQWRMPTDEEMLELISECYYTHKVVNGVSGLQFKGKTGGIIFLPFCGYRDYLSKIRQSDCRNRVPQTSLAYH